MVSGSSSHSGLPLAAALGIGAAMSRTGQRRRPRAAHQPDRAARQAGSLFAVLALIASRLTGELPETVLLGNWLSSGCLSIDLVFVTDA